MSELPENTIQVEFLNSNGDHVPETVPVGNLEFYVRNWVDGQDGFVSLEKLREFLNPPKPEKAPKEPRRYQGIPPGDDFIKCATLPGEDGDWLLYAQKSTFKGGVRKYKLITVDPLGAPHKGNYELYCEQRVVGRGGHVDSLKNFRPELFRKFEEWVTTNKIR